MMAAGSARIRILFTSPFLFGLVTSLRQTSDVWGSSTSLAMGARLRDRFVLHKFLHSRQTQLDERVGLVDADEDGEDESDAESDPVPGKDFPTHDGFQSIPKGAHINAYSKAQGGTAKAKHLGRGSFGDVWQAYDEQLNQSVVVKIFYDRVRGRSGERSKKRYTTKRALQKIDKLYRLERWIAECTAVRSLMEHADKFPEGAKAICQCFEEHVSDAADNEPLFLVQEVCGSPLDEIFSNGHYRNETPPYWNREVIKDVLQGVKFLSMLNPPRIHHDLKLENVGVMPEGQGKLLDFGALVPFEKAGREGGVCTPQYVPPEVNCSGGPSYDTRSAPSAFDVYSVGVMYWELMCNDRPDWIEDDSDERGYVITNPIPKHEICPNKQYGIGTKADFDIIKGLLKRNPKKRMDPSTAERKLEALTNSSRIADHLESWKVQARNYWRPTESRCNGFTTEHECVDKCVWTAGSCHLGAGRRVTHVLKKGGNYVKKCFKCLKMKIFGKNNQDSTSKRKT